MLLNSEQKKKDLKLKKKKHKFDSGRFFSVANGGPLNVFVDWPTDDDFPRPHRKSANQGNERTMPLYCYYFLFASGVI